MPPLQRAILHLEGDADGDGQLEQAEFHMLDVEINPGVRTGFIVGGRGSAVHSVISSAVDSGELDNTNKRRGFYVDLGGGAHTVEIEFNGWEGATDENGNPVQWGDSDTVERTQTNATGQAPITAIDVLTRYLTVADIDSRNPARLEYGEYSDQGLYDPLDCVVEGPTSRRGRDDVATYSGTMTCIAAADIQEYFDATQRRD